MDRMATATKRRTSQGSKPRTTPRKPNATVAEEEAVYAEFVRTGSYQRATEKLGGFGIRSRSTVYSIVHRLKKDEEIERERTAMRVLLAHDAMAKIGYLIEEIDPREMGTERSSRGSEAARAAADLGRVLQSLEPKKDADIVIPEIHVFTGIAPPSDDEAPVQGATGPDGKVTIQ
jgi:hypothetical protein